jgi:hypothetical protein
MLKPLPLFRKIGLSDSDYFAAYVPQVAETVSNGREVPLKTRTTAQLPPS